MKHKHQDLAYYNGLYITQVATDAAACAGSVSTGTDANERRIEAAVQTCKDFIRGATAIGSGCYDSNRVISILVDELRLGGR